jgi:hypothetical protein
MHDVEINVAMAKRYNKQNVFFDFNRNNVMPIVGNMDRDGG